MVTKEIPCALITLSAIQRYTYLCPTQLYSQIYSKPDEHLVMSLKLCDPTERWHQRLLLSCFGPGPRPRLPVLPKSQASFLSPYPPPVTAPPSSSRPPPLTFYTLPRSLCGQASLTHLVPHQLPTSTEGRFRGHHPRPVVPDLLPSLWAPPQSWGKNSTIASP